MYAYHRKTLIVFVVLLSLLLGQVVYAQETPTTNDSPVDVVTAVPFSESPPGTIEISLAQLNESSLTLRGPIDAQEMSFSLPYRWQFKNSGYLQIYFDLLFDTFGQNLAEQPNLGPDAQFEVEIDGNLVTSVNITEVGRNQALQIPLPLLNKPASNRHDIRFTLNTGRDCDAEGRTSVVIHDYSFMHVEFDQAPVALDFGTFPRPLVQELLTLETISLIVPDGYSEDDLSTAVSLAAMLGQKQDDSLNIELLTASEATPERLGANNAIAIGTPANNSYIADLYANELLPTTLDGAGAILSEEKSIFAEDGVLQLVQPSEEAENLVLVVSGTTDAGVARAAQALSIPLTEPRFGFEGDLAVIEAVAENEATSSEEETTTIYTLAELGFRDTTLYGVGTQTKTASFFVPSNWRITEDALLLITYIPSAVLQSEASALTVLLNSQPVGSTILDGSIEGERELLVRLPADEILLGATNRLRFQVTMDMAQPCLEPNLGLAWTRIRDNGRLQISHVEAGDSDEPLVIEDPLTPLISRTDLSDVWFALPADPTSAELNGLVQVAATLGDISRGYHFAPRVGLGSLPADDALASSHIVSFGEPLRTPAIDLVNDVLPQPFLEGSNTIRQEVGSVIFRLPEDFSLGLIESVHAPWNQHRAVTVVTGTNDEGTNWAINAITNDELSNQLNGNLAFIRHDRVEALDLLGFEEARAPLTIIPNAVAKVVQSSETAVSDTQQPAETGVTEQTAEVVVEEAVVLEPVPTPDPQKLPEQGALPTDYQPEAPGLPADLRTIVFGLIAAGVVIAALGLFLSARRAR